MADVKRSYSVVLSAGEDGIIIARSPDWPNVVGNGETAEAAVANLTSKVEAIVAEVAEPKKVPAYVPKHIVEKKS